MVERRHAMCIRGGVLLGLGLALPFILRYIGGTWGVAASLGISLVLVVFGGLMLAGHFPPDEV